MEAGRPDYASAGMDAGGLALRMAPLRAEIWRRAYKLSRMEPAGRPRSGAAITRWAKATGGPASEAGGIGRAGGEAWASQ